MLNELKDRNQQAAFNQQTADQLKLLQNDLLRQYNELQKNEINQTFGPIIENLKAANAQAERDNELYKLVANQTKQIQELQNQIALNVTKGAGSEVIDGLQAQVDEIKYNMQMNSLNRELRSKENSLNNEIAKLGVEEKIAEREAEAEDFCNPETAKAEVDLHEAKHVSKLSINLINTQRETNKELAIAKLHLDTLGMTDGLMQAVGLSGRDDITNSLTAEQCNGYIFKEKTRREEKLNALQECNSTLNAISKTTNEIDALYQSAQYKREVLGQKLQGALNNMFGEKYRSPLREAEREKVYKNLLHERGDEIAASIKEAGIPKVWSS